MQNDKEEVVTLNPVAKPLTQQPPPVEAQVMDERSLEETMIGFEQMATVAPRGNGDVTALETRLPSELEESTTDVGEVSTAFREWNDIEEFDPEDLTYPKLRIGQPTTPEVAQNIAPAGSFILSGYEPRTEVVLIPMLKGKAREYKIDGKSKEVQCRSKDSKRGVGNPGGICKDCPLSQWSGEGASRKPPACNLIYSYLCWSVSHDTIVVMEFKNTGKNAANFFNVNIKTRGLKKFAVHIRSQQQQNDRRQTYYVPVTTFGKVDEAVYEMARQAI